MTLLLKICLIIAGIIHIIPVTGVLGAAQLQGLYGLDMSNENLILLMRHRAVLFGLLGAYLCFAAIRRAHQLTAIIAGLISVISFLWLSGAVTEKGQSITRIVTADQIALACLLIALGIYYKKR